MTVSTAVEALARGIAARSPAFTFSAPARGEKQRHRGNGTLKGKPRQRGDRSRSEQRQEKDGLGARGRRVAAPGRPDEPPEKENDRRENGHARRNSRLREGLQVVAVRLAVGRGDEGIDEFRAQGDLRAQAVRHELRSESARPESGPGTLARHLDCGAPGSEPVCEETVPVPIPERRHCLRGALAQRPVREGADTDQEKKRGDSRRGAASVAADEQNERPGDESRPGRQITIDEKAAHED
jgi:hypothetical protein